MLLLVGLAGLAVGAVLGLTGAGGSILAVPLLMAVAGWTLPEAAPVALLAVCASTTFGTIVTWNMAYVRHRAAMLMALAAFTTAPLGLAAARTWPLPVVEGLFAAVLVLVAVRMILQARRAPAEAAIVRAAVSGDAYFAHGKMIRLNERGRIRWNAPAVLAFGVTGAATGLMAGLLGVGGGFVIVPALRASSELSMHSIVATSLLGIALISGLTVAGAILQGVDLHWAQAVPFVLGALAGMLGGRQLAPRIAGPRLQQMFAAMMLLVAVALAARVAT